MNMTFGFIPSTSYASGVAVNDMCFASNFSSRTQEVTAAPAPRELTDVEVSSMWAMHPDVSFSDFFQDDQEA
jgi:hypothetical protein